MGMDLYNSLLAAKLADGGDFSPTEAQTTAMNSGIDSAKVGEITLSTNNGVKNIWKLTIPDSLPSGFTITEDTDGGYIFNGTAGSGGVVCSTAIYFGIGEYILSGCPTGGSDDTYRLDILRGANSNYCYGDEVKVSGFTPSTSYQCRIRIAPNYECDNLKFYPMIRPATIEDPTFAPYAPSNRELYKMILALQD